MTNKKSAFQEEPFKALASAKRPVTVPEVWRVRPFQPVQHAAYLAGLSPASIYRLAEDGRLVLKRLAGRTLVETESLILLLDSAEAWTKSGRADKAIASRVERAKASWEATS